MTAVDPVAAYEAGVQGCHGAPQRECCVRAGNDAVLRLVYRTIRRHAATYRDTRQFRAQTQACRDDRNDPVAARRALSHEFYARGIEAAARDIAELLGVPECEIDDEADEPATLRTPEEWLTQPEFAGTEILDHDGWRDRPWTDPITRDEFRRRLYQCTITAPVPEGWGAMLRHGAGAQPDDDPSPDRVKP